MTQARSITAVFLVDLPEMGVLGTDGSGVAMNGATSIAKGTDWGGLAFHGSTVDHTFMVTNGGLNNLALTSSPRVTLTGDAQFSLAADAASLVGPGAATPFTIRFDPSVMGTRTALVSIANNDNARNPYVFALTAYVDVPAVAGVVYVRGNAAGLPENGSSWNTAYRTLTNALARSPADSTFWMAQGTQTWGDANGMVVSTHTIMGGFSGAETDASQRNWTLHPTILDGQGSRRAFYKTAVGTFTLDGVTVQNAMAAAGNDGGGVRCSAGDLQILNCVFSSNVSGFQGGAIFQAQSGSFNVFSNCTFVANSTTLANGEHGGAIHFNTASTNVFQSCSFIGNCTRNDYKLGGAIYEGGNGGLLQLTGCVFADNTATGPGGAIYSRGTLDLSGGKNEFRGNVSARDGGAIFSSVVGTHTFDQCAFVANSAQAGGAICFYDASTIFVSSCTFFANTATTGQGGAINSANGVMGVTNCIFWGNASSGTGTNLYGNGTVTIAYSDIDTNDNAVSGGTKIFGAGIITADPLFASTTVPYDVRLRSKYGRWTPGGWAFDATNSPCIDAGDPDSPYSGELRPNGNRINMGFDGNTAQASQSIPPGSVFTMQ